MGTGEQLQPTLEQGQIIATLELEGSDEVISLFKQQFPYHAVSVEQTVMLLVHPPLTEQEQQQWRHALAAHFTNEKAGRS